MGRDEDAVKKTKKSKELKLKKRNNNSELSENDGKLNKGEEEYAYTKSSLGKKRKGEKDNSVNDDGQKKQKKKKPKKKKMSKSEEENGASINEICQLGAVTEIGADKLKGKSTKARNKEKKDREELTSKSIEAHQDYAYVISSGDEDCTKGMKKWIIEYHQSRPGLKVLQQIINEFITAHETKVEEEKEKEVELKTEGGFELVTHHKGRKKTTDPESGTTVGSVSQAAAEAKMSKKKKKKEIGINFYRFQKREAKMNEILMLQTRFEQDRKRIQEKRAQRKFRPY